MSKRLTRKQLGALFERHWYDAEMEYCGCGWLQFAADDSSYDRHLADVVISFIWEVGMGEENE